MPNFRIISSKDRARSHLRGTLINLKANCGAVRTILVAALGTHTAFAFPQSVVDGCANQPELQRLLDGTCSEGTIFMGALMSGAYPTIHDCGVFLGPGRAGLPSSFYCADNGQKGRPAGIVTIADDIVAASSTLTMKKLVQHDGDAENQDATGTAYPHLSLYASSLVLQTMMAPQANGSKVSTKAYYNGSRYPFEGGIVRKHDDGADFYYWAFGSGRTTTCLQHKTADEGQYMGSNCGLKATRIDSDAYDSDDDFSGFKGCPNSPSPRHVCRSNTTDFGDGRSVFSYRSDACEPADSRELDDSAVDGSLKLLGAVYDLMWNRSMYDYDPFVIKPSIRETMQAAYMAVFKHAAKRVSTVTYAERWHWDNDDAITDVEQQYCYAGIPTHDWDWGNFMTDWDRVRGDASIKKYSVMSQRGIQKSAQQAAEWACNRAILHFGYHTKGVPATWDGMEKLVHRRGQATVSRYLRHAYTMVAMFADFAAPTTALSYIRAVTGADAWGFTGYTQEHTLHTFRIPFAINACMHDCGKLVMRLQAAQAGEAYAASGFNRAYLGYSTFPEWTTDPDYVTHLGSTGEVPTLGFVPTAPFEVTSLRAYPEMTVPVGFKTAAVADGLPVSAATCGTENSNPFGQTSSATGSYLELVAPYVVTDASDRATPHAVELRTLTEVLWPAAETSEQPFSGHKAPDHAQHDALDMGYSTSVGSHRTGSGYNYSLSPVFDDFSASISILGADDEDVIYSVAYGASTVMRGTLVPPEGDLNKMLSEGNYGGYTPQVFLLKKVSVGADDDPVSSSGASGVPVWNGSGQFKLHLYV